MIGVDKAYRNNITPYDLYPEFRPEKTLREVIYDFPRLEWGEIYVDDFYHAFRTYKSEMREWIHDLKEGESAFDNDSPEAGRRSNNDIYTVISSMLPFANFRINSLFNHI